MQLVLSKDDKEALSYGRMLNDKLINFPQMLLKTQFSVIEGLESTLLQYTDLQNINQGVQIIHSCGNHWVLASTIGCNNTEVNIYDSLYESVDHDTLKIVQNRFSFSSDLNINVIIEQKQTSIYDCGYCQRYGNCLW